MNEQDEKIDCWSKRIQEEYTPLQRLLHEVRIYSELAESDINDGEDLTGARLYQKLRLEAAIDEVRRQDNERPH